MQNDRARLFLPFKALDNFEQALKEKERIVINHSEKDKNLAKKWQKINIGKIYQLIYINDNNEIIVLKGIVTAITSKTITIVKTTINYRNVLMVS